MIDDWKYVLYLHRKIRKLRSALREQDRINDEMLDTIHHLRAEVVQLRQDALFGDLAKSSPLTRPANQ